MVRPKVPLVDRRLAVESALRLIDTNGLDAFSTRALGTELGVSGAALYHHFTNKEELQMAVAEHIFQAGLPPHPPEEDWRGCLLDGVTAYRDVLLAHPNAVPLLLRLRIDTASLDYYAALFALMRRDGLTNDDIITLISSHLALAIGSAMRVIRGSHAPDQGDAWLSLVPGELKEAAHFRRACIALQDGLISQL